MEWTFRVAADEYNELRKKVGWDTIPQDQAEKALNNTTYIVAIRDNDSLIAMARMISDSGFVAFLTDVMVSPDYQGKGLGYKMIENIKEFVGSNIKPGQTIMLHVMAAEGKEPFYIRCGFTERPTDFYGSGMTLKIKK